MREILFRGKRKDNGEWIEGGFFEWLKQPYIVANITDSYTKTNYEVIPETVGQYTGLTDKNGKKIFEGDIIGWNDGELDETGKPYEDEISEILFCEEQRAFIHRFQNAYYDNLEGINCEFVRVIGNIHDNPELLKGGAEE